MYKKLISLCILEVLRKYSDVDHRLLQNDIIRHLQNDYCTECERKAISRNIETLIEFGYDIAYDKGYYIRERLFEESELRLLIDGVMASRQIPADQGRQLIDKLNMLSSIYFKKKMRHVWNTSSLPHTNNKEFFYTVDILSEAIEKNTQVSFYYSKYGVDKKLHPVRDYKSVFNPYQIVMANGKYYLIGNYDQYDNAVHCRLDLITEIESLNSPAKPMKKVQGLEDGLILPKYMAEHVYMYSGKSVLVKMRVKATAISEVIEWFGDNIVVVPKDDDWCLVQLRANENAMFYWGLQYGMFVEILEPEELRNKEINALREIQKTYCIMNP